MRITLVIYSMQAGGAERVLSIMANYWSGTSHKITLITLEGDSKPSFYGIDSRVKQVFLGVAGVSRNWFSSILNNLRRIYALRGAIRDSQPDTVISFLTETNVLTLISMYRLHTPVLVTEHTDPWVFPVGKMWQTLRLWFYPRASRVVVLSQRVREYFNSSPRIQVVMIPNPVVIDTSNVSENIAWGAGSKHIIMAMGRLSQEKRFDLLIHAFSYLANKNCDWNLMILGEGSKRKELEALRDKLGLNTRVILPGAIKRPHSLLKRGNLFVLCSDYEAFPMALCEAMACGLPVIATDYSSAVHDIVENGQNGILVPTGDSKLLADAIIHLINHPNERNQLAEKSVEVGMRFSLDSVMEIWEKLLVDVVSNPYQSPS